MANLRDAVRSVSSLVEQFQALSTIKDALSMLEGGEAKIAALLKQKESIEQIITNRKKELRDLEEESAEKVESKKAELKSVSDEGNKMSADLDKTLSIKRAELAEITRKIQVSERDIRKKLVAERNEELGRLDKEVERKTKQLNELNSEMERIKSMVST